MSAKAERSIPVKRARKFGEDRGFLSGAAGRAILLRCGALMIDYILIISIPVICMLVSRYTGNDGAKLLNSELNNTGWLIAILIGSNESHHTSRCLAGNRSARC